MRGRLEPYDRRVLDGKWKGGLLGGVDSIVQYKSSKNARRTVRSLIYTASYSSF